MREEEHHNFLVRVSPDVDSTVHLGTRCVPVNLARPDLHLVPPTASLKLDREPIPAKDDANPVAHVPMPRRCLARLETQASDQSCLPPIQDFLPHRATLARAHSLRQT